MMYNFFLTFNYSTRLHEETIAGPKKRTPECCGISSASKTAAVCGPLLPMDGEGKIVQFQLSVKEFVDIRLHYIWKAIFVTESKNMDSRNSRN